MNEGMNQSSIAIIFFFIWIFSTGNYLHRIQQQLLLIFTQTAHGMVIQLLLLHLFLEAFTHAFCTPPSALHATSLKAQQLGEFESLNFSDGVKEDRTVKLFDLTASEPVHFHDGWEFQKNLLSKHLERLKKDEENRCSQFDGFDSIIMLQHMPVYTLGTASDSNFVLNDDVEVVRIDRGGEVTYHGPGQLVVYPIIDLRAYKQDIHWYMRAMEESILVALQKAGIGNAMREDDLTGIWVDRQKIAALGIKARRWVTQHGLAINITPDSLVNFKGIVPCGLEGREVTCVHNHVSEALLFSEFVKHMKEALEEVFCIKLLEAPLGEMKTFGQCHSNQ